MRAPYGNVLAFTTVRARVAARSYRRARRYARPMPDQPLLDAADLPARIESVEALEEWMTRPSAALVDALAGVQGDLLILGVAGKMGPTLARLARRAAPGKRIVGVARFSDPKARDALDASGVETIACDLLDRAAVEALPRLPNVVFAAGQKFGSSGNPALTWAMNVHVPAIVAETFQASRIVAFSTGNVYPMTDAGGPGANESSPLGPVGEYAQSCVGRERMFEHFSHRFGTPGRIVRLNYAIDLRYGVLVDLARKIVDGTPIDLAMGSVNVIWQGDANAQVLRCLAHCTSPTTPINVTGPETLSVRTLAVELGRRLGREPVLAGSEAPKALLNDAREAARLFGEPVVPLRRLLDWVADWVARGGESLGKPTKFEVRDGAF